MCRVIKLKGTMIDQHDAMVDGGMMISRENQNMTFCELFYNDASI
jgi:hypothetical protein